MAQKDESLFVERLTKLNRNNFSSILFLLAAGQLQVHEKLFGHIMLLPLRTARAAVHAFHLPDSPLRRLDRSLPTEVFAQKLFFATDEAFSRQCYQDLQSEAERCSSVEARVAKSLYVGSNDGKRACLFFCVYHMKIMKTNRIN